MNAKFLSRPDGQIAYEEQGAGPLVVCVPGIGDVRGQYRFLAAQLVDAGFRVVTMDNRGHGESSVGWGDYSVAAIGGDILALIDHLDAGPAVVAGHSMAAGAAVWAAAEGPQQVRGLVLLGPAVHGSLGVPLRLMLGALFARPWGPAAWVGYYGKLYPTRKPQDWQAYTDRLKQNLAQPGRLEALRQMMYAPKAESEARLGRVSAPALILMGTKDPDFKDPQAEASWLAEQLKGSYQMVDGAGHYPHVEMPEVAGLRIVDFVQSLQPEAVRAAPAR